MSPHSPICSSSPPRTTPTNPPSDSPPPYTRTDTHPNHASPPAYLPHPMPLPLRHPRQHPLQNPRSRPRPRDSDLESLTEFLPWITHSPTTDTFTPTTPTPTSTSNTPSQLQPHPLRPRPTLAPLHIPGSRTNGTNNSRQERGTSRESETSPTETNIPFTNHYALSTHSLHMYQQQNFTDSTRTLVPPYTLHPSLQPPPHSRAPPPRYYAHDHTHAPHRARRFGGGSGTRVVFIDDEGVVRERDGLSASVLKKGGRGRLGLSICSWVLLGGGVVAVVGFIVGTVFVLRVRG